MITVITKMTVRTEKHREFVQTIQTMVDPSRRQNGCLCRDFYQDRQNENSFLLLEEWETSEDLDHHFQSDWFHILLGARNLLLEEPEMKVLSDSSLDRRSLLGSDADV